MLNKVGSLGGLFSQKAEHPLADPRELKKIIGALPKDNAFKSLDEIAGWLESLQAADDIPVDRFHDAVRQLEEAAQPHLKRLTKDYLHAARLARTEEKRLWSINCGFWTLLASAYERCLAEMAAKPRAAEQLKAALPAICAHLIGALAAILKWEQFHYGPSAGLLWQRLGRALLRAEEAGVAGKAVPFGQQAGLSSAQQEYLKAMVFQAASMDSLLPLEIELAERLIAHFLPQFVFTAEAVHDCVYWVDLTLAQAPQRLARMPGQVLPTLRFFKPGPAHAALENLLTTLQRGGDIPPDINFGGQYYPKTVIPVLRHLATYLAPVPPQRKHDRHRVKHRVAVLNGLVNAFVAFSGEFGGRPAGLQMESWVVENVSRGGFGAVVSDMPADWLKVGALLALQPEGGDNWLVGIVRRYHRATESDARVGIETLARQAVAVELRQRTASSYAAVGGVPALLVLEDSAPGEVRAVLPPMTFDLRESLEYTAGGKRHLLAPVALVEQTADFELARYRQELIG
ncbi:hypothetical protein [Dechloromonas denitrificans]|uniref:hypothetical protein n=1 Tax=Dechloromonas denitrificans TaxID=281362 RepID=UPI001CFC0987|nr:hypothetical protein [Dechloromonas denitrificans]UCV07310.1 hypothetical protein KI615_18230 [Dechloromonas denitrificans]